MSPAERHHAVLPSPPQSNGRAVADAPPTDRASVPGAASVAELHLVHPAGKARGVNEDVPPIGAPLERFAGAPRIDCDRFWIAAAVSLLLHAGLISAWAGWRSSQEARADSGSEDVIVIEGPSIVLLDSMPRAGRTDGDLPETQRIEEAAPASSEPSTVDAEPKEAILDPAAEATMADDTPAVAVTESGRGNAVAALTADNDAATPVDDARAVDDAAPTVTAEPPAAVARAAPAEAEPAAGEIAVRPAPYAGDPTPAEVHKPESVAHVDTTAADTPAKPVVDGAPSAMPVADVTPRAEPVPPSPPVGPKASPKPPAKKRVAASPAPASPASKARPAARSRPAGTVGGGKNRKQGSSSRARSSYEAKIAAHLRRYRSYPAEAERQGASGVAVVRFTVSRNGSVSRATLVRSSGHGVLDREAIAMVRRASPLPPMPQDVPGSHVTLSAPIDFRLR